MGLIFMFFLKTIEIWFFAAGIASFRAERKNNVAGAIILMVVCAIVFIIKLKINFYQNLF